MTPTQENSNAFSVRLKQSGVLVQVARAAAGDWFQSCGPDTTNARLPYLSVAAIYQSINHTVPHQNQVKLKVVSYLY